MAKEINENCPCTAACARHGDCEACKAHHSGGMTKCQRLEKKKKKAK